MIQIPLEDFNDLRVQANAIVEATRELGKDSLAFQLAITISNALIDLEDKQ